MKKDEKVKELIKEIKIKLDELEKLASQPGGGGNPPPGP